MNTKPELIGKGQFTKVYRLNAKSVVMKSTDPVKEAMAIGFFPNFFQKLSFLIVSNIMIFSIFQISMLI